ncbi:hypothetical protein CEXT_226181, partial [Caerostris extrusa]
MLFLNTAHFNFLYHKNGGFIVIQGTFSLHLNFIAEIQYTSKQGILWEYVLILFLDPRGGRGEEREEKDREIERENQTE